MFSASIPIDNAGKKLAFMIISQTDQEFGKSITKRDPDVVDGQTHFVRSRTDPKYYIKYDNINA